MVRIVVDRSLNTNQVQQEEAKMELQVAGSAAVTTISGRLDQAEIDARRQANADAKRNRDFESEKANMLLDTLTRQHDLQFTYVRLWNDEADQVSRTGGAVIAWKWPDHRQQNNMVRVAISWCHPKESFHKKLGRLLAATEYDAGRTAVVRLPCSARHAPISTTLQDIFRQCVAG